MSNGKNAAYSSLTALVSVSNQPYQSCLDMVKTFLSSISNCIEVCPLGDKEISMIWQVICAAEKKVQLGDTLGLIRLYRMGNGGIEMTVERGVVADIISFWGTYACVSVKTFNLDGSGRHTAEYWISCSCLDIPTHLLTYKNNAEYSHYCFNLHYIF